MLITFSFLSSHVIFFLKNLLNGKLAMTKTKVLCINSKTKTSKLMNCTSFKKLVKEGKTCQDSNITFNRKQKNIFYTLPNACFNVVGNLIPSPIKYGADKEGMFEPGKYDTVSIYYLNGTLLKICKSIAEASRLIGVTSSTLSETLRRDGVNVQVGWQFLLTKKHMPIPIRIPSIKESQLFSKVEPILHVKDGKVTRYLGVKSVASKFTKYSVDKIRRDLSGNKKGIMASDGGYIVNEAIVSYDPKLLATSVILRNGDEVVFSRIKGVTNSTIKKQSPEVGIIKTSPIPTKDTPKVKPTFTAKKTEAVKDKKVEKPVKEQEKTKKEEPIQKKADTTVKEVKKRDTEFFGIRKFSELEVISLMTGDTVRSSGIEYNVIHEENFNPRNGDVVQVLSGINIGLILVSVEPMLTTDPRTIETEKPSLWTRFKNLF